MSLLLFSFLFSGCSIAVMLYSFLTVDTTPPTQSIIFPKYAVKPSPQPNIRDSLITHEEYKRISQFRHYLERLQQDKGGKKVYDSLQQARPYLLDSIHQVDSIFLHQ